MKLVILLLAAALLRLTSAAETPASPADREPLPYFIIVTGGELLEGVYPDAHTPFLTRTLRPLGCKCVGSLTVDDSREDIQRAVRFATNRAPLVIVTGGLGPTPNDVTRETLSDLTGIELRESPEALADMERRLNQPRDQLRPNLRRQSMIPSRGSYLKNPNGTAVGLIFDLGPSVLVALPGPPKELQPMTSDELAPFLRRRFGVREFGSSLTLRFVGAGQSLIDQTIKDHVSVAPDVVITSLFEGGRVDFTFSLPGNSNADRDRLKRLETDIRQHLDAYIYADDDSTLEEVVMRNLRRRAGSLVILEMGSGGSLAAALTTVKDDGGFLRGAYVASTEQEMAGLLGISPEINSQAAADRTRSLAAAIAAKQSIQWAVATTPIQTGPDGTASFQVMCKLPNDRWVTQRIALRGSGEMAANFFDHPDSRFLAKVRPG